MISFIMPARNASLYVGQAVDGLRRANYEDWELIVIDDHSTDNTLRILKRAEQTDSRIKVFENKGNGKVVGLNYGYTLSSGNIIKCIDADDVLSEKFFEYIDVMHDCDALCHNSYVTASNLSILGNYSVDKSVLTGDFLHCLKYLKSLPRWTWSFTRDVGDKLFPMPANLPFEDVWFSLIVKKYAKKICHVKSNLYYYRQHNNQTFGGILNFNSDLVSFRARRMLEFIDVVTYEQTRRLVSGINDTAFFDTMRHFYGLLAQEKVSLGEIVRLDTPVEFRLKVLVYKKLSFLTPLTLRLKWSFDKRRKATVKSRNGLIINDKPEFSVYVKPEAEQIK